MRLWPRRYLTCSICGRNGERRKFDCGGYPPVCKDEDICERRFLFKQRVAAMPSAEEERAMMMAERDRHLTEILARVGLTEEASRDLICKLRSGKPQP